MGKKVRSDFYLVTDRHAKKYFFILQKHELLKQLLKVWICWPLLPTDYWRWAKYMGNYSLLGRCLAWAKAPIFIGVGQKVGHLSLSYHTHVADPHRSLSAFKPFKQCKARNNSVYETSLRNFSYSSTRTQVKYTFSPLSYPPLSLFTLLLFLALLLATSPPLTHSHELHFDTLRCASSSWHIHTRLWHAICEEKV